VAGAPVYLDPSVLILGLLLVFNVWVAYQSRFPQLDASKALVLSGVTAVLFLLSVLAHELAHAAMFRSRGITVHSITLHMLGGATLPEGEPKGPADEFLSTVVGPGTSALLGGLFLALHVFSGSLFPRTIRVGMFGPLALANLLMAGFNLLPGFPLDGGRLLLAGVWRATGDRKRATSITARVGQGVAIAIIAGGVALSLSTGDLLFGLWPAFIGVFLLRTATSVLHAGEREARMRGATAGQVMAAPPPTVASDLPVSVVMERYLIGHDGEAFPVMEDGHVAGFVSLRTARDVPLDHAVRDAMAGAGAVVEAGPWERMDVVLARAAEQRSETIMVVDGGRLVGVIEREDLSRFLRSRPRPGVALPPGGPAPVGAPPGGAGGSPASPHHLPPRPDDHSSA
jgi:Zn-dependent protease/predicted transcriptional regulator